MTRTRRSARRKAAQDAGVPKYAAEMRPVRGRCRAVLGRAHRPCDNRWGIVRVSVDLTSREAVDRLATVECASCGHVWYRTTPPKVTDGQYQSVRLSVIIPSELRRWYARGRWRTQGTDAVVIREATLADLMAAMDDWRARNGQYESARARARAKREATTLQAEADAKVSVARLASILADRETEEAAAAARDAV